MHDSKRWMGVLAFLVAMPAWASDMCELGMFVFLPPVFIWAVITFLVGLAVRKPGTARVSMVLLLLGGFPVAGSGFISLNGAFHGSELKHVQMFVFSAAALVVLFAASLWTFARLTSLPRNSQPQSQVSQ